MRKIDWRYAIGEIIIVIVGITIAFALNNWSQEQANKQQREQYLTSLRYDLESEAEHISSNETEIQRKIVMIRQLLPVMGRPEVDRDTFMMKIFDLAGMVVFNPESTTYQTLVHSGDMKLIKDFDLRRSVEEHYSGHEHIAQEYVRIKNIHERYLADLFIYEVDYAELRNGNTSLLDNPVLKNTLISLQGAYFLISQANKEGLESTQALMEKI